VHVNAPVRFLRTATPARAIRQCPTTRRSALSLSVIIRTFTRPVARRARSPQCDRPVIVKTPRPPSCAARANWHANRPADVFARAEVRFPRPHHATAASGGFRPRVTVRTTMASASLRSASVSAESRVCASASFRLQSPLMRAMRQRRTALFSAFARTRTGRLRCAVRSFGRHAWRASRRRSALPASASRLRRRGVVARVVAIALVRPHALGVAVAWGSTSRPERLQERTAAAWPRAKENKERDPGQQSLAGHPARPEEVNTTDPRRTVPADRSLGIPGVTRGFSAPSCPVAVSRRIFAISNCNCGGITPTRAPASAPCASISSSIGAAPDA